MSVEEVIHGVDERHWRTLVELQRTNPSRARAYLLSIALRLYKPRQVIAAGSDWASVGNVKPS